MNMLKGASACSQDSQGGRRPSITDRRPSTTDRRPSVTSLMDRRPSVTSMMDRRPSVTSRDSGFSSKSSRGRSILNALNPLSMLNVRSDGHDRNDRSDVDRESSLSIETPRSPRVATVDKELDIIVDAAEQRRFADLVAEKVLAQLRRVVKTCVSSAVGEALDATIADRMLLGATIGLVNKPFSHESSKSMSEETLISNNRASTVGSDGRLKIPAPEFDPIAASENNSVVSGSSLASEVALKDLGEKKKPSGIRRRNSIGTMERMLADNLFSATVYSHRAPNNFELPDARSSGGDVSRKNSTQEHFSSIQPNNRHGDRKASREPSDLNGIAKKIQGERHSKRLSSRENKELNGTAKKLQGERHHERLNSEEIAKRAQGERHHERLSSRTKEELAKRMSNERHHERLSSRTKEELAKRMPGERHHDRLSSRTREELAKKTYGLGSPPNPIFSDAIVSSANAVEPGKTEVQKSHDGDQHETAQPDAPTGKAEGDCKHEENACVVDTLTIVPGGIDPAISDPEALVAPDSPDSPGSRSPFGKKKSANITADAIRSMRQVRENELMEDFIARKSQDHTKGEVVQPIESFDDSYDEWEAGLMKSVSSPGWLRICGILPWDKQCCFFSGQGSLAFIARLCSRTWYQLLVRVLVTLSLGFYIYEAVAMGAEADALTYECQKCLQAQLMSDMPLALGSLLGLLLSDAVHKNNIIGSEDGLLVCFCHREGLITRWAANSRLAHIEMLFLWVCMVGERVRSSIAMEADVIHTTLHVVSFALITGVLMGLAYCLLHVCRALATMTDAFCSGFAENPCCQEAVRDWNVLQAVLRKVSYSVECVFLVMLTSALVAVCLPLLRHDTKDGGQSLVAVVPAALVLFSVARISFRAGAVTYKCDRVPALINSLTFGKDIDHERQYVINYILHSMAGFYVFEVRVTADMVLKFAYVSGAIVFGVLTQLLS